MTCPKCANTVTKVTSTTKEGGTTQRLRFCAACSFSFVTVEKPVFIQFSNEEKEDYESYLSEA